METNNEKKSNNQSDSIRRRRRLFISKSNFCVFIKIKQANKKNDDKWLSSQPTNQPTTVIN